MSDYNYLNARIKALKRDLFPKGRYDELFALRDFEAIKRFFLESPYAASVGESLAQHPGELGVGLGLSRHIHKTFQNVLEWSGEEPRRLLELYLRRYDLHNMKTLIRGKNGKLPSETILENLIPVGSFGLEELTELSKQPSLWETIILLANWHHPLKRVLRKSLPSFKQEPADLRVVEAQLDLHHYLGILLALFEEEKEDALFVKRVIQMEVDMTNVLTLLRLSERPRNELSGYLIDGGSLGRGFFLSLTGNLKPIEIVQKFETTYFSGVVKSWKTEEGLTDLERRFEKFLLQEVERMARVDPLSIGVAIAYMLRLSDEVKKLRVILHGKFFALDEAKLKEELLLV